MTVKDIDMNNEELSWLVINKQSKIWNALSDKAKQRISEWHKLVNFIIKKISEIRNERLPEIGEIEDGCQSAAVPLQ